MPLNAIFLNWALLILGDNQCILYQRQLGLYFTSCSQIQRWFACVWPPCFLLIICFLCCHFTISCVCVWLPVIYHLSFFIFLFVLSWSCSIGVFGVCVFICVCSCPLSVAVSQKASLLQIVPSVPGFCPCTIRGFCSGLPGKVSVM